MGRPIDRSAALKMLASAIDRELKKHPVQPGIHLLSGIRIEAEFPEIACVSRSAGELGHGKNSGKPQEVEMTLTAALIFIRECGCIIGGERMKDVWATAIRASMRYEGEPETLLPQEAKDALAEVIPILPLGKPINTPALCTGADMVEIAVRGKKKSYNADSDTNDDSPPRSIPMAATKTKPKTQPKVKGKTGKKPAAAKKSA